MNLNKLSDALKMVPILVHGDTCLFFLMRDSICICSYGLTFVTHSLR